MEVSYIYSDEQTNHEQLSQPISMIVLWLIQKWSRVLETYF